MFTSMDAQRLITLVEQGVSANSPSFEVLQSLGLWHLSSDQRSIIASHQLLRLRQRSPSSHDTVAAILATEAAYQAAWGKIVAAQLKDAGSRQDDSAIVEQISLLGDAAQSVLAQLDSASLEPTALIEVERLVFGQTAEQSASYPKLLRTLAAAATIKLQKGGVEVMVEIAADNTAASWQANRLIEMPRMDNKETPTNPYLLTGLVAAIMPSATSQQCLVWLQANPWAYVLAQVAYTQDIWRSEQIAGGLRLEIEPEQAKHFMRPSHIQVVVTTRDDREVSCGTLAELLIRALDSLRMALFTALDQPAQIAQLDAALSPVIGLMVEAKVWQFIQGSSKDIPHYHIHSQFEPLPNTRLGTIGFSRPGQAITAAIREQAERWAVELSAYKSSQA